MQDFKHLSRVIGRVLRRAQQGEDATFEFTVMVVPMVALVFMIGFVTIYWASRLPARAAASDCARAAVATLNQNVGVIQGEKAGRLSLAGNNINSSDTDPNVVIQVTPNTGGWRRGDEVTCTVRYTIHLANTSTTAVAAPGSFEQLLTGIPAGVDPAALVIVERVKMKVDPLKSNWTD